jgi:hypothetical protein
VGVDADWEVSPVLTAAEFARVDRSEAATTSVVSEGEPEGGGGARVTVTFDGLLDDSIQAERYILVLDRRGANWRLAFAERVQRCALGRGHRDFAAKPCR